MKMVDVLLDEIAMDEGGPADVGGAEYFDGQVSNL